METAAVIMEAASTATATTGLTTTATVKEVIPAASVQETSSRPVLPCVQGSQPGQLRVIAIYNYLHISIIIRVFGACVAGCAKRCPAKK